MSLFTEILGFEAKKVLAEVENKFTAVSLDKVIAHIDAADGTDTVATVWPEQPEFTVNANGGKKQTGGKPLFNQVPEAFTAALTEHMRIGAQKYGHANWCKGMTESQTLEATRRHYAKRRGGENIDPETGSSHYLAITANAMMAWSLEQAGKLEDDRTAVYVDSFVKSVK